MKGTSAILIALGVIAVLSELNYLGDTRPPWLRGMDAQQATLAVEGDAVFRSRGRCCNDSFRQALPLSETPVDPLMSKP